MRCTGAHKKARERFVRRACLYWKNHNAIEILYTRPFTDRVFRLSYSYYLSLEKVKDSTLYAFCFVIYDTFVSLL